MKDRQQVSSSISFFAPLSLGSFVWIIFRDVPIGRFTDGEFVTCRVLGGLPKQPFVEVSLRPSRIEGDLEVDSPPEVGESIHAYVVDTHKKGCFLRLSREVEGRVILKELCDGFLPNPAENFPMGRLVVGKVKEVKLAKKKKAAQSAGCKQVVDLDLRESVLLASENNVEYDDIEIGGKYKGTVTRIEDYGVFVRIENSKLSGLVHKSECSDNYVKRVQDLYDPGDMVKVLVLKKDEEKKNIGFSMKASHFEDDEDSEDDSISGDESEGEAEALGELDSDDENFASKLAEKMSRDKVPAGDSDDSASEANSDSSSSEDEKEPVNRKDSKNKVTMDTDVGFDWGGLSSKPSAQGNADWEKDEDDDSSGDESDGLRKSSHKSRKKHAQRLREEQEISKREAALADGTADDNPETAGDFERLLAGNPNSSELWIKVRSKDTFDVRYESVSNTLHSFE
jgi:rRNA biogenesis protein RRP5